MNCFFFFKKIFKLISFPNYRYIQMKGKNRYNDKAIMKKLKSEKNKSKRQILFHRLSEKYKIIHKEELLVLGFSMQ